MKTEWKSVCLTEGQATFVETIKKAIKTEFNIKVTTNDILSRIVEHGFHSMDIETLINNPMTIFKEAA
tara:strand:+ start:142 stop:345 length:204 start_codon:yes stop_codon:yes gene_type:complete